jgi:hypothetical protein
MVTRAERLQHFITDAEPPFIARLLGLAWWDWPVEKITRHARVIATGTVDDLERAQATGPA